LNIFPNPNNGNFTIETNNAQKQILQIFDVTGNMVMSQVIIGKVNIDGSLLNEGVYNICITNGDGGVINKRMMVVK
ncbi:MAG TPA: T9SS type A sorting domain-containing protein, partial [Nitrosopumilaceae archaeon]|nr:T9SS type A sorting domain-containing protein [Nitrosopumilaceae archaeon]